MTAEEWSDFYAVIDTALSRRPASMRRQLRLFLGLLNVLAWLQHRRSLTSLSPQTRAAFLSRIENSNMLLFRRGFWGIRTLVFMGYYARPACASSLGYAATPRGWELRR